jgi:hypothetical protein
MSATNAVVWGERRGTADETLEVVEKFLARCGKWILDY